MKKTRILWISRHPSLNKQINELTRIFGDIELIQYAGFVRDSDHVVELMKHYCADEVVTILPLTIIYHLIKKHGIKPIYPEMEETNSENYDYKDINSGRKYKFVRFVRLINIILVKEPLEQK